MDTYKINHELNQYDYVEGIEFNGLMPKLMKTEGIDTIGNSDTNVKFFGADAKGNDSLEVVDIDALNEDEFKNKEVNVNDDDDDNDDEGAGK